MIWWERQGRIQWELDKLTQAGFRFDKPASTDGAFMLPVYVVIDGQQHRLEIEFPELYPYFRFEVRAPTLDLPHHQHPFGKNLCVIPRATHHWRNSYSIADTLATQLPRVITAGTASHTAIVTDVEEHQAEPATEYYQPLCEPDAMILIDSTWHLPDDFTNGQLRIWLAPREQKNHPIRGIVQRVATSTGNTLYDAPPHLQRAGHTVDAPIVKLDAPLYDARPDRLEQHVRRTYLHGATGSGHTTIVAIVMPEEHAWRDNHAGQGWLFIANQKGKGTTYIRAGRAGTADLGLRTPELASSNEKGIAVFGLGCIGGTSTVELAKSGIGRVRLADHDFLDPGALARWYLGLSVAGQRKAPVLAQFIKEHYPTTLAEHFEYRVGSNNDLKRLAEITEGMHLVYDATAEDGVSYFLSDLARQRGMPYLHVSGTHGGWGGRIIRLTPQTGCWWCYKNAVDKNVIGDPPEDTSQRVQPAGCGDPTFTGTGFDLGSIALAGVRTAISTLCPTYPQQAWDVMIISLRDANGALIAPRYDTYPLPKDPACPACGSA